MTQDQAILFALLVGVFGMLIWGRIRYDLVAFGALVAALVLGVVPEDKAFDGFGHPATVIIALVLIVSRGLSNSGAIETVARLVLDAGRPISLHIGVMASVGAALSAIINNVGALALLMPIDLEAAKKAKRAARLTLMPLSFATILGGLVTLIGTPPNIIIAKFRETELGEPFSMFDFSPVGLVCALAGIAFVALVGWRLIPKGDDIGAEQGPEGRFEINDYIAEVLVPDDSPAVGKTIRELGELSEDAEVLVVGVVRRGRRLGPHERDRQIRASDVLVLEAQASAIDKFVGEFKLEYAGADQRQGLLAGGNLALAEVVVPEGARAERRSANGMRLLYNHGITLLGISRQGAPIFERVRKVSIQPGDVLLLLGPQDRLTEITEWLGALPLADRGLAVANRSMALIAALLFAGAVALASFGVLNLAVALAVVALGFVLLNIVPVREIYTTIEWPVIVLLGSMIPIGVALQETGGTTLIANGLIDLSLGAPAWVVLLLLMIVTMTLSDILNNTATTVIAAPIALDMANRLQVNPDAFLMTVAVAASCAFLTPIGHKNNTLIMGPGGYRFSDYWQMGLPLEIIVIAVAVPSILFFWPL